MRSGDFFEDMYIIMIDICNDTCTLDQGLSRAARLDDFVTALLLLLATWSALSKWTHFNLVLHSRFHIFSNENKKYAHFMLIIK